MMCSTLRTATNNFPGGVESAPSSKYVNYEDHILYDPFPYKFPPEFPGGLEAMYTWIKDEMKYPAEALTDSAYGRVTVEFLITENGSVENARVVRGRHPALDAEALRIVNKMPRWKPAIRDDQPIEIEYILPIQFKLPPRQSDQ